MSFTLGDIVGFKIGDDEVHRRTWCLGKTGHATPGAAAAALRSLVKRGLDRPEHGDNHVYQCPRCLKYHTGHQRKETTA